MAPMAFEEYRDVRRYAALIRFLAIFAVLHAALLFGVDGAVVTTEEPELIGFGGIIQGNFEMGGEVARAIDPEAKRKRIPCRFALSSELDRKVRGWTLRRVGHLAEPASR